MNKRTYKIAKIIDTALGTFGHGIMTCMLTADYGDGGNQGVGGYALDRFSELAGCRIGTGYGLEFIRRVMSACGVERWELIKGRTVYVVTEAEHTVVGLAPLPTEPGSPFIFAELKAKEVDNA